jgi:hypothetical protein
MTKFSKADFIVSGDCVFYGPGNAKFDSSSRKFIVRFKHRGPFTKSKFLKELVDNHNVQDYFEKLDSGVAPLAILRDANPKWYYSILEDFSGRSFS